jgi:hypothetical protein
MRKLICNPNFFQYIFGTYEIFADLGHVQISLNQLVEGGNLQFSQSRYVEERRGVRRGWGMCVMRARLLFVSQQT